MRLLLPSLLAVLPVFAFATSPVDYVYSVNGQAARGVGQMFDMEGGGRWRLELSPGLWSLSANDMEGGRTGSGGGNSDHSVDLSGWSFSAALKRELSERWGIGLIGAYAKQTGGGDISGLAGWAPAAASAGPGGAGYAGGEYRGVSTSFIAVALTYNAFAGRESGFRMPISFGPALVSQKLKYSNTVTATHSETAEQELSFGAIYVNLAFDIPVGADFRVVPGGLVAIGPSVKPKAEYDYSVTDAGTTTTYKGREIAQSEGPGTFYVGARYLPWNLAAYGTLPIAPGASLYSLTWTKKF